LIISFSPVVVILFAMSESSAFSVALGLRVGEGSETASFSLAEQCFAASEAVLYEPLHTGVLFWSLLVFFGGRPALSDLARPSHGEDRGDRLDFRGCREEFATRRCDRGQRMGHATGRRRSESLSGSATAVDEQG
jgi:hypothetical protein